MILRLFELNDYERERLKAFDAIPKPWELPRPWSPLPWKVVEHTEDPAASVVGGFGKLAVFDSGVDASFAVRAANEYVARVEAAAYLRGLVRRLSDRLEFERDLLPYDEDAEALLQEARKAIGEVGDGETA